MDELIDYSSKWVFELLNEYKKTTDNYYYFVSDWNVTDHEIGYPFKLIDRAANETKELSIKYLFVEDQQDLKSLVRQLLNESNFEINLSEISIVGSATSALYATLLSLHKLGITKYLIFTPVYFSILETLKDFGADIYYFHLRDIDGFKIDNTVLAKTIDLYNIQAVIITDPLYSCGIGIPDSDLSAIAQLSVEKGFYLVDDSSLGGLVWTKEHQDLIPVDKLKVASSTKRLVFIDSLSKKLLVNGIKSALIIGNSTLISVIEKTINQFYGGFNSIQLSMVKELYLPKNRVDLEEILNEQIENIVNNFELLESILRDSDYYAYPTDSGFFTIVAHKYLTMKELDVKGIIRKFLFDEQVFALPSFYFCFHAENKFGFRVNLLLNPHHLMPAILKCIRIDLKPFKEGGKFAGVFQ
jgi:aspartate/methionine/tyrosine aminotransferase